MSNMSYCRFRNTLGDLQDCFGAMEEMREAGPALDAYDPNEAYDEQLEMLKLSREEEYARVELIELCEQIVREFSPNQ